MNGSMKEYILRIIAAAILCALIKSFAGKSSAVNSIIKTLCGVFLSLTILSPLVRFNFSSVTDYIYFFSADAQQAVEAGVQLNDSSLRSSIKQHTEAYILDKAASLNAELTVEVTLSADELPAPCSVVIEGKISPYARSKLTQLIADDLGISKENQTWI